MNNDRLPTTWTSICTLDDIVPNTGVCREADLPACEPEAPAKIRLFEVREEVGIEQPHLVERVAASEEGSPLRGEALVRARE